VEERRKLEKAVSEEKANGRRKEEGSKKKVEKRKYP
jgi:hypothetical protein